MQIAVIGENCSGKSTLADALRTAMDQTEVYTGKDYLRLDRSEPKARDLFREKLKAAAADETQTVIYVISEPDQLELLPENAVRILVQADLETIRTRFRARMHGQLPGPVAAMLEKKHGMFDNGSYDYVYDGVSGDPKALCAELASQRRNRKASV